MALQDIVKLGTFSVIAHRLAAYSARAVLAPFQRRLNGFLARVEDAMVFARVAAGSNRAAQIVLPLVGVVLAGAVLASSTSAQNDINGILNGGETLKIDPEPNTLNPENSTGGAAVPTLDIESGCREVFSYMKTMQRTADYSRCMADERAAQKQLENEWMSFDASAREECLYSVKAPAIPSYVALQGCLRMSRTAKNLPKSKNGYPE